MRLLLSKGELGGLLENLLKPIAALTVGLVAAFKYEILKLYLSVAVLPVSSNVHELFHFFFLSFVLSIVYFYEVI